MIFCNGKICRKFLIVYIYTGIVTGEDEDTDDENVHFEVVSLKPECPQESIANKDEQSDNEQETSGRRGR